MMFVTKRGLSDACNVVGGQLNQVSDTVTVSFILFLFSLVLHLHFILPFQFYFLCFSQSMSVILSGYHFSGYKERSN